MCHDIPVIMTEYMTDKNTCSPFCEICINSNAVHACHRTCIGLFKRTACYPCVNNVWYQITERTSVRQIVPFLCPCSVIFRCIAYITMLEQDQMIV